MENLVDAIRLYQPELVTIRHDIHQHPEVGFEEVRTAALVAARLREWGLDVTEGVARTGVVATLKGKWAGQRSIGLRADLDALHIQEPPGREYGSTVPGKIHACGHDGHTVMLLGAARYLAAHPDFGGTVVFIFQPAEDGLGGGREMVEEGLFDRFPVDAVYGMHNTPGMPVGAFRTRIGAFLAASDSWTVDFRGTGGHGGAGAHLSTDRPCRWRASSWRYKPSSAATWPRRTPPSLASVPSAAATRARRTSSLRWSASPAPHAPTSRRSAT